jgi:membrane-bound lytic murein transglycosylase F
MLKKFFFLFVLVVLMSACEQQNVDVTAIEKEKTKSAPTSLRTWQQIKASGYITALKLDRENEAALPRTGSTSIYHRQLLTLFAQEHDLQVKWITVSNLKLTSFLDI